MDMNLTLSAEDVAMIVEALDCYDYWELGQDLPRNNGAVLLPGDTLGDTDPYWTESPTDTESEAIDDVRARRLLAERMQLSSRSGRCLPSAGVHRRCGLRDHLRRQPVPRTPPQRHRLA